MIPYFSMWKQKYFSLRKWNPKIANCVGIEKIYKNEAKTLKSVTFPNPAADEWEIYLFQALSILRLMDGPKDAYHEQ
jgi:hypothetical protein